MGGIFIYSRVYYVIYSLEPKYTRLAAAAADSRDREGSTEI